MKDYKIDTYTIGYDEKYTDNPRRRSGGFYNTFHFRNTLSKNQTPDFYPNRYNIQQ